MGMGKDLDVLRQAYKVADFHTAFGIDEDTPVEENEVTQGDLLTEIEPAVFLDDQTRAAVLEEALGDHPPEEDAELGVEADGELVEGVPERIMEVALLRR